MPDTLISRVRKLTADELDAELASQDHNDIGRHIILQEKTRRAVIEAARPNWMVRASLVVALLAAIFAGISALPEVRTWFPPDYGPPPTDACKQALQNYFGPNFALELSLPKQASEDDPDHPDQKIYGWLFEASGNFKPPSTSNFPMAVRVLARGDSIILVGPLYGPFERWGKEPAKQDTSSP